MTMMLITVDQLSNLFAALIFVKRPFSLIELIEARSPKLIFAKGNLKSINDPVDISNEQSWLLLEV